MDLVYQIAAYQYALDTKAVLIIVKFRECASMAFIVSLFVF